MEAELPRSDDGHMLMMVGSKLKQSLLERRIRQMGAIPRQQAVHPVDDGKPDPSQVRPSRKTARPG